MNREKSICIASIVTIILFAIGNAFLKEPSIILYIANLLPLALFTYYITLKGFAFLRTNNAYRIPNLILWMGAFTLAQRSFNYYVEKLGYIASTTKIMVSFGFFILYFILLTSLIRKPVLKD